MDFVQRCHAEKLLEQQRSNKWQTGVGGEDDLVVVQMLDIALDVERAQAPGCSCRGLAFLDATSEQPFTLSMNATLSADGKIVIPPELRESAHLNPGDTLDIQLYKGTLLLRKHQPLSPEQCASLLERSRSQPKPTPEDDAAVEQAVREVRSARR